jgi:hypothetical protein
MQTGGRCPTADYAGFYRCGQKIACRSIRDYWRVARFSRLPPVSSGTNRITISSGCAAASAREQGWIVGLLDELDQEAQRLAAGADDVARVKQQREEIYRTRLEPGMAALYEYLTKLTQRLTQLKPRKVFGFEVAGYGEVKFQVEHEYDLKYSNQPTAREIRLAYPCGVITEECPSVEVQGATKVKSLAGAFQRFHLAGLMDQKKDANGEVVAATFRAKGRMLSGALFSADANSGVVRLGFGNFDQLGGSLTKTLTADQFNEGVFDEIGRYLMREPNTLFKESLPEDFRKQLRSKVQQEELKRKWEVELADRQREELSQLEREHSLLGRFGKVFAGKSGQAQGKPAPTKSVPLLDKLKNLAKKDK